MTPSALLAIVLLPPLVDGSHGPAAPASPAPAITAGELEAHVRWLADDARGGRATGTPGAEATVRYLARALAEVGVEPAGDEGGFLQRVPLERARTLEAELELASAGGAKLALAAGRDFDAPTRAASLDGLALVVVRTAADVPNEGAERTALFLDAPSARRRALLEEAGRPDGRGFALLLVPGSSRAREPRAADALSPPRPPAAAGAPPSVRVHGAALERLRAGEFARASLAARVETLAVDAWNVVGVVRGAGTASEPDLAAEAVVLSAHHDHLPEPPARPGEPEGEDRVHNGADDDASGCAAVLEIAAAFAHGPRPARTIVVLLAAAEEIGLHGTRHYLAAPAVPLERTVANLNFEMVGRPDALVGGAGRLWLTGFERTNLGPAFAAAGLPILADPRPDQNFYQRSDNYAFVERGVVGQTFSSYDLHEDYHRPSDEADRLDWAHMEAAVRAAHAACARVASGELDPAWTGSTR